MPHEASGIFIAMHRRFPIAATLGAVLSSLAVAPAFAQMDFGMRGGFRQQEDLVGRFDADRDGRLDDGERKAARDYVQSRGPGRGTSYRTSRTPAGRSDRAGDLRASAAAPSPVGSGLYDEAILRTLYLRFPSEDWYDELADFYDTGIDVPAALVVDGHVFDGVGVRFRGNSSYRMTGDSLKKSFNLSVDHVDPDQRLYGYRTLNLLNANTDPSMVREVLFSHIAREYVPAPKANFVKLVVNGENWGIYVNVQQFNRDFAKDWFDTRDGVRFKVPAGGRSSGGSLAYLGGSPEDYRSSFDLQSAETPEAWNALVRLCETLNQGSGEAWEAALASILDVDGALWALALENVFIDGDGYLSRGSDYLLYQDPGGRFHVIPYDNNETFRFAGGGGPNSWPSRDNMLSPMVFEGSPSRPLVSRLLAVPALRARYLSHYRTIVEEWLDWDRIGPLVARYQKLIDAEVEADDKKLYSYEAFLSSSGGQPTQGEASDWRGGFGGGTSGPSLRSFVTQRRDYLSALPELAGVTAEGRAESPAGATHSRGVPLLRSASTDVVINELMARNSRTLSDPQGEYEDWIELANVSNRTVSLEGMYLTDDEGDPRKWRIPSGHSIPPGGYLLVWADDDRDAPAGLHAGFRLSSDGEIVLLVDADERGNQVLDEVRFPAQQADEATGRYPDGRGAFRIVRATPGRRNEP